MLGSSLPPRVHHPQGTGLPRLLAMPTKLHFPGSIYLDEYGGSGILASEDPSTIINLISPVISMKKNTLASGHGEISFAENVLGRKIFDRFHCENVEWKRKEADHSRGITFSRRCLKHLSQRSKYVAAGLTFSQCPEHGWKSACGMTLCHLWPLLAHTLILEKGTPNTPPGPLFLSFPNDFPEEPFGILPRKYCLLYWTIYGKWASPLSVTSVQEVMPVASALEKYMVMSRLFLACCMLDHPSLIYGMSQGGLARMRVYLEKMQFPSRLWWEAHDWQLTQPREPQNMPTLLPILHHRPICFLLTTQEWQCKRNYFPFQTMKWKLPLI